MLMKYKDFKQMSANEMKSIVGGKMAELKCKVNCYKSNGNGGLDTGTCSKGSVTVNGTSMETCDCSLIGASSCNDI
jgi:bacteriocin-like protein